MSAANSRYDLCSPPPSYRSQEGSILSVSSLPSYHSFPPAGHTSGGVVVAPPSIISPSPSYTSQVGSVTPSIASQANIFTPPSYASQIGCVTPSFSSLPSYYPQPPMAYSAVGNFQPNLGMVPEMGMYYGVQSVPISIPQYISPPIQQVVNYPMQQTYQQMYQSPMPTYQPPVPVQMYQPPIPTYQPPMQMPMYQTPMPSYQPPMQMQMYQSPVMPPSVQIPGGYTIVDTTNANWVYSDSSSDPTGTRIRVSWCYIQWVCELKFGGENLLLGVWSLGVMFMTRN